MIFRKEYRVLIIVAIFFMLLSIFRSTETFKVDYDYGYEGDGLIGEVPIPPPPQIPDTTTSVTIGSSNSLTSNVGPGGATGTDQIAAVTTLENQSLNVIKKKKAAEEEEAAAAASAALEKELKKKQEKLKQDCEQSVSHLWAKPWQNVSKERRKEWNQLYAPPAMREQCLSTCIKYNNKKNKCGRGDHLDEYDTQCPFNNNVKIEKGDCHTERSGGTLFNPLGLFGCSIS